MLISLSNLTTGSNISHSDNAHSSASPYLHLYQGLIRQSKKPVITGGGAVGLPETIYSHKSTLPYKMIADPANYVGIYAGIIVVFRY